MCWRSCTACRGARCRATCFSTRSAASANTPNCCVAGAGEPGEKRQTYRLGGPTCLAGDVIGDYSFDRPLKAGDRLVFEDMAIYTIVKNNTFNGMPLPSIVLKTKTGRFRTLRAFGYEDFKTRLS